MEHTTRFGLHSQTARLLIDVAMLPTLCGFGTHPTGLSPSTAPRPRGLGHVCLSSQPAPLQTTILCTCCKDSKSELIPLHSPLLRESWLVSFPPLINMLKSSG